MVHDPRFDVPHDFRREPLRRAVAVGLAMTAVASVLPWIEGTSGFGGPIAINGFAGPGDGGFLVVFGIGQAVLALSRWAAEARSAILRVLPALIGAALILTSITAQLDATTELRGIEFEGGRVAITVWFWLAIAGAILMALAGFWLTVADRLRKGPWLRSGDLRAALNRQALVPLALGIGGAIAGFVAVLYVGAQTFESALVLIFVVVALFGGIIGGWLGYRVGQWLVATPPGRDLR
jgi:hypothetical protein